MFGAEDLRDYFGTFGTVICTSIKYDAMSGNPRGFGFITFEHERSVDDVLKRCQHVIKDKVVDPKRAKSRPICKKIFVGGIDANMPEEEIRTYFGKYGKVCHNSTATTLPSTPTLSPYLGFRHRVTS